MGLLDLLNHLANFAAPALWMAVAMSLLVRLFMKKLAAAHGLPAQAAINFVVCLAMLMVGLGWFGNDGKMATYALMTVACATSQWMLLRGGKA